MNERDDLWLPPAVEAHLPILAERMREAIDAETVARYTVMKIGPGGPIKRQWFDEEGNFHTLYENDSESVISAELLRDDQHGSEGT